MADFKTGVTVVAEALKTGWAAFEEARERSERVRAEFGRNLSGTPQQFRVIDCKSTVRNGAKVALRDGSSCCCATPAAAPGYTAVSHTFGMDVYRVFDCSCTSTCLDATIRPRYASRIACPGRQQHGEGHWKTVADIVKMCEILMAAGAEYVWHDGVCIAQHDDAEVKNSIKHMGWIYANAKETVIFLHYVGSPMAPIIHEPHPLTGGFGSRWQTRVWTLQEAAVSTLRRYCVRYVRGHRDLGDRCKNLQDFQNAIADCYKDDSSVAVMEERDYFELLRSLHVTLGKLIPEGAYLQDAKLTQWMDCLGDCISTMIATCIQFPTADLILTSVGERQSKHDGDRINSILALAGVRDFVVPKDPDDMEAWTIEFFKRQGQQGLALAVFSVNLTWEALSTIGTMSRLCRSLAARCLSSLRCRRQSSTPQPQAAARRHKSHSWVPNLALQMHVSHSPIPDLLSAIHVTDFIQFKVLCDGRMRLTGKLASVAVRLTRRTGHGAANDELQVQEEQQYILDQGGANEELQAVQEEPGVLEMDLRYRGEFRVFAQGSAVELGKIWFPFEETPTDWFAVIEGHEIREGELFHGCCVFPAEALQLSIPAPHERYDRSRNPLGSLEYWNVPAILVTAPLPYSQVLKVAFFSFHPEFMSFLHHNPTLVTILHKLVIL